MSTYILIDLKDAKVDASQLSREIEAQLRERPGLENVTTSVQTRASLW
jgi:hypothetical protein